MYNLIAPARVPTAVHLDRKKNEEVAAHTSYFNAETGEKLLDRDMQKYQVYGGKKIAMEYDEVESLRRLSPPGLVLLGFKPTSCLKPHHHYRPAMFLFPDEKQVKGSTRMFRALLDRCLARDVMPICKVTPRRNMPPRLVALLPQASEFRSETAEDKEPPGFNAIFLPFAEDVRDLTKLTTMERPSATETQVEKAKAVMQKLKLKHFKPADIKNPVMTKHYRAVEAMALERENVSDEILDQTKPNLDWIQRRCGELLKDFRDSVFPPDYNPKRKGTAASTTAAKRAKTDQQPVDLETEAKAGRLGKLTVPVLKEHTAATGIRLKSTRKADIIDEINKHYGI